MRQAGIRDARRSAQAHVSRLGIEAPEHIRIEAIARRLGASVLETPLDGAQAQLARAGADARIMISERVKDPAARRFSIAHELGHFVLEHPSASVAGLCGKPKDGIDEALRDYEAEANAFASELLMPRRIVQSWCEVSPVTLDVPWRIARELTVSILAAARRFVELSPERCAAVFSANREVLWCTASATFAREIARGRRLDPASVAWDFYDKGAIDDRAQPVPADAWFETSIEVDIVEHSIASHEHSTVLSLLWIPEYAANRLEC